MVTNSSQNRAWIATMLLSCLALPLQRVHLKACEIHNGLDEDDVVADVGVLGVKLWERAEQRAAAGDVHLAHRPLEGGGSDVRPEGVDDVLPATLVQQHQSHLLVEGPLQQSITQSSHHHKEKRQVTATPCPVPIQVDPQTHLIAVFTGVECWWEHGGGSASDGVLSLLGEVRDPPDEDAVECGGRHLSQPALHLRYRQVLQPHRPLQLPHLRHTYAHQCASFYELKKTSESPALYPIIQRVVWNSHC